MHHQIKTDLSSTCDGIAGTTRPRLIKRPTISTEPEVQLVLTVDLFFFFSNDGFRSPPWMFFKYLSRIPPATRASAGSSTGKRPTDAADV